MNMKKIFLVISISLLIKNINAQVWNIPSAQPNDAVQVLFTDTVNNLFYAGGQFTKVDTITVNHIAKWNGSNWDSLGSGFDNSVFCIAMYNGELYAGGWLTASGSDSVSYIAKWNGTNWEQVGGGLNYLANSFAVYNGELYVGGGFTQAGGNSINYIAKWNGTTWSSVGSGTNFWVKCLSVYNNELYAGGWFDSVGVIPASGIAKWNGTSWSSLGSGTDNVVRTMSEYKGKLYVGGDFLNVDNINVNCIASWDGSQWSSAGAGFNTGVNSLCFYNTELYAAGNFSNSGSISLNQIARWNGFGWNTVGNGLNSGGVDALGAYGGDLYVGGVILYSISDNLITWNNPVPTQPTAAFTVSDSMTVAGSCVKFVNQSTGSSLTYLWSFPGGTPSSSVSDNPIVCYSMPGNYDVTLIAATSAGVDTLIKTLYIVVDSVQKPIPPGISSDYLKVLISPDNTGWLPDSFPDFHTMYEVYYYKPYNYDSINGPILWSIHGIGGNASTEVAGTGLQAVADRRKALYIAVTMHNGWGYGYSTDYDSTNNFSSVWLTNVFKQIYRHVLIRENRSSVPVHLIGFSAGGQCVTRYMLIRQSVPDSIPIQMAVSTNPYAYTFCTDSLSGVKMFYPCGTANINFLCNEHVKQYYNENYAVLIGTADTDPGSFWCFTPQGNSRYERAQNFYHFSDSDAVVRGTTLKWQYDTISGIGHDVYAMYNTILAGDSMPLAERLLFETPYHTVPLLAPTAGFTSDTSIAYLPNATVHFYNSSINVTGFLWDFGDSTNSTLTHPTHTYSYPDTFTVTLTVSNGMGCENKVVKKNYIVVINPNEVSELGGSGLKFNVYPNPTSGKIIVTTKTAMEENIKIIVSNILSEQVAETSLPKGKEKIEVDLSGNAKGVYFIQMITNRQVATRKIILMK